MEAKGTLKDLIYLGVGAVSLSAHKLDEYAHEIISRNENIREEGKSKVEDMRKKAKETLDDLNQQKEALIKAVAEKTKMAENEISDFFNELMKKPKHTKEQLLKIDEVAHNISLKTQLTAQEVKVRIEDFVNQLKEAQKTLKTNSEKVLTDVREQAGHAKENALELIDKIDDSTHEIREEMAEKTKNALHKLWHTLDLASGEELSKLDERIKHLEKK